MIVVTTPTGNIGSAVAESLRGAGAPLRLIARDPSRLPEVLREYADVVTGSHGDRDVLDRALAGAEALFVLVPGDFGSRDVRAHYLGFARPIADAVRAHDVRRVVAVSSLGRGFTGPAGVLAAAWAMDDVLESGGVAYRSLQPPFFMENLLRQLDLIRDHGTFVLTADPDAPHPVVATSDIVRTATDMLTDTSWSGQDGVVVREPVDHTPRELAQIMTEVLGRPIAYRQATLGDYRAQLQDAGASPAVVDAVAQASEAQNSGVYPPVSAGGTGTSFRDWCETVLVPAVASRR